METITIEKHPKLAALIARGVCRVDGETGTIVGTAGDGQEVIIGDMWHLEFTEQYLDKHPNPDQW